MASDFDNNAEQSIDPFIQQRLGAEVRSVSRGGNEGLGNVMFINGLNSLKSTAQPLVVVDGVIMDMQYERTMLHDGYYNNILANINVNDIDKVEVLRNGTAIYGAKGANGVIIITTKRNRSMATKIDVTIGGKFQLMPRTASMLGAEDFRTYTTELLTARVTDLSSMKYLISDPSYYYYNQYHNHTDWKKEVYENAFSQNYGINVQGGDDVANYNLSVGYTLANSTLKKHDFSRFDMRLNTDINITKNLDCRFDASFSDVSRNLRDIGIASDIESITPTAPNFIALIKSPFLSPYAFDINGNVSSYLAEADDYLQGVVPTNDRSIANPLSILQNGEGRNRNTFGNRLVMFSITPTYHINKHLTLSEAFNFSLIITNEKKENGRYLSYLTERGTAGTLTLCQKSADELAANDSCAWYISFTPDNQYFQFRNAATGRYITFNGSTFSAKNVTPADQQDFQLMKGRVDADEDGTRGFWITRHAARNPMTMAASNATTLTRTTFNLANSATGQRWVILDEAQMRAKTTTAMGIESITDKQQNAAAVAREGVYTLDGRKVARSANDLSGLSHGIYIVDGKKVAK